VTFVVCDAKVGIIFEMASDFAIFFEENLRHIMYAVEVQ